MFVLARRSPSVHPPSPLRARSSSRMCGQTVGKEEGMDGTSTMDILVSIPFFSSAVARCPSNLLARCLLPSTLLAHHPRSSYTAVHRPRSPSSSLTVVLGRPPSVLDVVLARHRSCSLSSPPTVICVIVLACRRPSLPWSFVASLIRRLALPSSCSPAIRRPAFLPSDVRVAGSRRRSLLGVAVCVVS
ncbi:hypothetical protein BDN70DRAFT_939704 [Pholiota conissans]|uniref:Uncharacterized protein n=1 Tax=Pholiota conissans TaxID=109636 RepID=A0A9P5YIC6_9AGAR|nr:hypothetical protein BDN70DRAFT_939704 [Pholiota conissans]